MNDNPFLLITLLQVLPTTQSMQSHTPSLWSHVSGSAQYGLQVSIQSTPYVPGPHSVHVKDKQIWSNTSLTCDHLLVICLQTFETCFIP